MYRLFAYALLLNIIPGHFWHDKQKHGCGYSYDHRNRIQQKKHRHQEVSDFERLSQCVKTADRILKTSCTQSPYSRTREFLGVEFYSLKYNLQEFPENTISVKVKNRVIYVRTTQQGIPDFTDLRILPQFVNSTDAAWYFDNGMLTVLFSYKNKPKTEVALDCVEIDNKLIVVAKMTLLKFLGKQ
ncbi:unnamed protein product, partial [Iphiclides podalirius]